MGKYNSEILLAMFKKAAKFRNEMNDAGFTDNGGAIHSAERILGLLAARWRYPGLGHINNYKNYPTAEFSDAALKAYEDGQAVKIEHVAPHREFTRTVINMVSRGDSDNQIQGYVKETFRLVLLTPEEMNLLNKRNRSKLEEGRLEKSGIFIAQRHNLT